MNFGAKIGTLLKFNENFTFRFFSFFEFIFHSEFIIFFFLVIIISFIFHRYEFSFLFIDTILLTFLYLFILNIVNILPFRFISRFIISDFLSISIILLQSTWSMTSATKIKTSRCERSLRNLRSPDIFRELIYDHLVSLSIEDN